MRPYGSICWRQHRCAAVTQPPQVRRAHRGQVRHAAHQAGGLHVGLLQPRPGPAERHHERDRRGEQDGRHCGAPNHDPGRLPGVLGFNLQSTRIHHRLQSDR